MYVAHNTASPQGRLGRYFSPYNFPLPVNSAGCGLAGCGQPGMSCANCGMSGLGQSATAIKGSGMRIVHSAARMRGMGMYRRYGFPLPADNLQGLGALTTKTVVGAAVIAAAGWFVYKKAKKR